MLSERSGKHLGEGLETRFDGSVVDRYRAWTQLGDHLGDRKEPWSAEVVRWRLKQQEARAEALKKPRKLLAADEARPSGVIVHPR